MNLEVHAMGWWWWAPICRTRAYFGLLACLTSSIPTYQLLEFCLEHFAFVISAFWEPKSFCTHSDFSCKIPSRALHRNIAMLPRGLPNSDEMYPMSRRALCSYAGKQLAPVFQRHVPTQQMSHPTPVWKTWKTRIQKYKYTNTQITKCQKDVMFLHNKCPTRPPYPCIRLALYKVQFSVFSDADALCAVQLQTVQIKKCILLTAARQPLLSKECSLS